MKIKDWLKLNHTTQGDFCKLVNVSRSYLSSIITGRYGASYKLAKAIEKETNGDIKAEEVVSGQALGKGELSRKRIVLPSHRKIQDRLKKSIPKKLSLL